MYLFNVGDCDAYNLFRCQEAFGQSLVTALFNDEGILRVNIITR